MKTRKKTGITLREAILSGHPFKLENWACYVQYDEKGKLVPLKFGGDKLLGSVPQHWEYGEVMSDDYILMPKELAPVELVTTIERNGTCNEGFIRAALPQDYIGVPARITVTPIRG